MGDDDNLRERRKRKFSDQIGLDVSADGGGVVTDAYFDRYSENQSYEDVFGDAFSGEYVVDLITAVWGSAPPYKLLDCGSASGLTLRKLGELGIEAWGIENSPYIHAKTPEEWRERNILGDVCEMPFEDNAFDFLYVTCLCHLPENRIDLAIREMLRVCRTGVVLHGVTVDMTEEVIEDYKLFAGLQTFWTFSEWSDAMLRSGFHLAVSDPRVVDELWRIEQEYDEDDWDWYPNKESMRRTFFGKQ